MTDGMIEVCSLVLFVSLLITAISLYLQISNKKEMTIKEKIESKKAWDSNVLFVILIVFFLHKKQIYVRASIKKSCISSRHFSFGVWE